MLDRRRTARHRAFSTARLSWPAGAGAVDGVLRNLSRHGAMLLVDDPARLPVDVELRAERDGSRRSRVVWRGAGAVGIVFLSAASDESRPGARPAGRIVSLAEARAARRVPTDAERLAARVAAVLCRPARLPPDRL